MYSKSYKRCSFPASETSTVLCNEDLVRPKERHVILIDLRIETMDMNSFLKQNVLNAGCKGDSLSCQPKL